MTRRAVVCAWCCLSACAPTEPTHVTLLAISPGTDLMTVGGTESFSAFAVRSDGNGSEVEVAWASENPAVVTVSPRGLVTAVAAGLTRITATYQGATGSRALRVVPSFGGSWSGAYRTTACSATDPTFCRFQYGVGGSGRIGVFLTQVRDTVSGFVFLDSVNLPVAGAITIGGTLLLQGGDSLVRIENWTTSRDGLDLSGRFTHLYPDRSKAPPQPLTNRVDSELVNVRPIGPP